MTKQLSPLVWFGTRQVIPTPKHFIKSSTPVTRESLLWVITSLKGRYSTSTILEEDTGVLVLGDELYQAIFFEDTADAMMYELRWSGSK